MRILFLAQIVPYPPDAGPRVKTWNVLRYLAQRGHEIVLATYVRPEERASIGELQRVCTEVHAVPLDRSRVRDVLYWLISLVSGRPFLVERDDRQAMRSVVEQLMDEQCFDVVHADQLTMAQFAPSELAPNANGSAGNAPAGRPRLILDAHNAVWTVVDRMRKTAAGPLRPLLALETGRVRRYEGETVHAFDHTLAVSEVDRRALLQAAQSENGAGSDVADRIAVVPIAVDTDRLQPLERDPSSKNIVTLGTLHYPPNADGIRWFLSAVFPQVRKRVPEATLTIIGKNPPDDLWRLARDFHGAVQITGYVPDLEPYLRQAAALVVPVRAGGGMRVRILEGFARAMPMVTTTVGLEGIDAHPDRDILVADREAEFAGAVVRLLQDQKICQRLALNGRELAVSRYDWRVVLQELDKAYAGATQA